MPIHIPVALRSKRYKLYGNHEFSREIYAIIRNQIAHSLAEPAWEKNSHTNAMQWNHLIKTNSHFSMILRKEKKMVCHNKVGKNSTFFLLIEKRECNEWRKKNKCVVKLMTMEMKRRKNREKEMLLILIITSSDGIDIAWVFPFDQTQ